MAHLSRHFPSLHFKCKVADRLRSWVGPDQLFKPIAIVCARFCSAIDIAIEKRHLINSAQDGVRPHILNELCGQVALSINSQVLDLGDVSRVFVPSINALARQVGPVQVQLSRQARHGHERAVVKALRP